MCKKITRFARAAKCGSVPLARAASSANNDEAASAPNPKALLRSKQLEYEEIDVTSDAEGERAMIERSRRRTVPQIFVDEQSVGGYDDLAQLNATGELDRLLNIESPIDLTKVYDVVIVGAGPAGMSAAIYAVRKK